jgi:hypothetical protein
MSDCHEQALVTIYSDSRNETVLLELAAYLLVAVLLCYFCCVLSHAAGYGYVYFFHVLWGLSFRYTLLLANFLAAALAFTFFKEPTCTY